MSGQLILYQKDSDNDPPVATDGMVKVCATVLSPLVAVVPPARAA